MNHRLAVGFAPFALAACATLSGTGAVPPLALERTDLGMEALSHGTLTIDGACTWLVAGRDRWLLVWPEDRTRWDAVTGEVVFTHRDGVVKRVRHGQEVAFGGGAINDIDGIAYTGVDWVLRPAPGCDTPTRWHVSSVVLP
ncbi:MAG TPA: hypothetical protein VFY23_09060 [Candidatus Limnocylindrales bacterium]|nr:hypothetical protein [Candidatus Limnocylindrales bacterium]